MSSVFLLTHVSRGAPGHGEPAPEHISLATDDSIPYVTGDPLPAFATREAAQSYIDDCCEERFFKPTITELQLVYK